MTKFANFTEETCTGTGDTQALAGATDDMIQFQKSYSDGEPVPYVIEDSGGTIKVGGIGTYVSATDDITRNDLWSWDGTTYDDSPSSNIALSGGTHTIRCAPITATMGITAPVKSYLYDSGFLDASDDANLDSASHQAQTADRINLSPIVLLHARVMSNVAIDVGTADAGATKARIGIYRAAADSSPGKLVFDVAVDVTSTGLKQVSLGDDILLDAGKYYGAFISDGTPSIRCYGVNKTPSSLYGIRYGVPRSYNLFADIDGAFTELPENPTITGDSNNFAVLIMWD